MIRFMFDPINALEHVVEELRPRSTARAILRVPGLVAGTPPSGGATHMMEAAGVLTHDGSQHAGIKRYPRALPHSQGEGEHTRTLQQFSFIAISRGDVVLSSVVVRLATGNTVAVRPLVACRILARPCWIAGGDQHRGSPWDPAPSEWAMPPCGRRAGFDMCVSHRFCLCPWCDGADV
ncbi:MAG: hypothetical protein JW940_24210 [Polyangiaceae bacterium]|nr:hypothetical protein [Polyangiaceae bacterium]